MVDLNRSTRTPLDSERPKLSVFVAKLYHTQERDGTGCPPPPQVCSRLVKKEVRARVIQKRKNSAHNRHNSSGI